MLARRIYAAVLVGVILWFVLGLTPVGWLAWVAPMPLLLLAFKSPGRQAAWLTALAALIGVSSNFHYYRLMMPLPVACLIICLQTLLWVFIVGASRRIVLRYMAWWTVFAYPVLWAAVDTLAAHFLKDTNWGSLAYSQAGWLPMLQVTSLFGTAGLLFLLSLLPAAMALAAGFGGKIPHLWRAYAVTAVLLLGAFGYGLSRITGEGKPIQIATPAYPPPPTVAFGLASIDDPIGMKTSSEYIEKIWQSYDQHIASLAAQGAAVIVLPEKIGLIAPITATTWQHHLSAQAAQYKVWIAAGVGVDDNGRRTNLEWLFAPDGHLEANYSKHHMAPPEREYLAGSAYETREIAGRRYGLAICKDMHFATFGREYGKREVSATLVPAWDFDMDRELALRTTLTRGVENGYSIVRASREGMLSVTDPYGRVLGSAESRALPGTELLVRASIAPPVATLYTRIGDLFGWLCVAAAAVLLVSGRSVGRGTQAKPELSVGTHAQV